MYRVYQQAVSPSPVATHYTYDFLTSQEWNLKCEMCGHQDDLLHKLLEAKLSRIQGMPNVYGPFYE
jgi:hypothetical protein